MFFKKLLPIYNSSGCDAYFPQVYVEYLDQFIIEQLSQDKRVLSPYTFSNKFRIDLRSTLRFFMFFAVDYGVFEIRKFIDCAEPHCHTRIYISNEELANDQFIFCEECGCQYSVDIIKTLIKIYFYLKPEIKLPEIITTPITRDDPNSTYLALEGLPEPLKVSSPSSTPRTNHSQKDEGDSYVDVKMMEEVNHLPDGSYIINDLAFLTNVTSFTRR